jgi:hypothetical protein
MTYNSSSEPISPISLGIVPFSRFPERDLQNTKCYKLTNLLTPWSIPTWQITKDLIDTNNNLQIDKREPSKTCRNWSTDIVASEITV